MKSLFARKKKGSVFSLSAIVILGLVLILAACAPVEEEEIILADATWESIQIHNAIAQFILEEGYGYDTDTITGGTIETIQGMRAGDIDVYMEVWIENIGDEYQNAIDEGDFYELSVNFDDNEQGLYVPTYVIEGDEERNIEPMAPDLETISDLHEYWEVFEDPDSPGEGRIYGGIPGWEADDMLQQLFDDYGFDEAYNYFSPGSETALNTSLMNAYENGEAWVGYNWEPTWIIGRYDMTLLQEDDEDDPYFVSQPVTVAANADFADANPDVVEFLENYVTSSEITSEALDYMEQNESTPEEAGLWFLEEYEDLWTEWVPEDVAEDVQASLQ